MVLTALDIIKDKLASNEQAKQRTIEQIANLEERLKEKQTALDAQQAAKAQFDAEAIAADRRAKPGPGHVFRKLRDDKGCADHRQAAEKARAESTACGTRITVLTSEIIAISKELGRLQATLAEQDRKSAEIKAEQAREEVAQQRDIAELQKVSAEGAAPTKLEPTDDKPPTGAPTSRP